MFDHTKFGMDAEQKKLEFWLTCYSAYLESAKLWVQTPVQITITKKVNEYSNVSYLYNEILFRNEKDCLLIFTTICISLGKFKLVNEAI
jgi:hypothetical protein